MERDSRGYHGQRASWYLTPQQRQARLLYAHNNLNRDWSKVIFSDEKVYIVRRQKSHLYNPNTYWCVDENVEQTPRNEHKIGRYWGWISRDGPGEIVPISGLLNSEKYCEILEDVLIPSIEICYEDIRNVVFMQDNNYNHVSGVTRKWFAGHPQITVLDVPLKSPDLNPIEDFWSVTARNLQNVYLNSVTLDRIVVQNWESWRGKTQYFENLYDSMPYRLRDVIKNNGGPTSY